MYFSVRNTINDILLPYINIKLFFCSRLESSPELYSPGIHQDTRKSYPHLDTRKPYPTSTYPHYNYTSADTIKTEPNSQGMFLELIKIPLLYAVVNLKNKNLFLCY